MKYYLKLNILTEKFVDWDVNEIYQLVVYVQYLKRPN